MKLFQCKNCHAILRYEADKEEHSNACQHGFDEYELEEFLTRFVVTA
jgi:rubredoxin